MKTFTKFTFLMTMAALAISLLAPAPVVAQQAKPTELSAMILMADGSRRRGFVQNSNEKGLLFTLVEGSPGEGFAWGTQVVAVAFDDADEFMREARASFSQGKYDVAAEQFGAIADTYPIAAYAPNNFATEARYYQIESLRLLGRFAEMAPLMETPTAVTVLTKLSEFYHPQFKFNQLWAQLGSGQLDGIKAEVEKRQIPQTGQAKLLPSPSFQKMPMRELVQMTFMRAKVAESEGQLDLALSDYYRTFSYTYGNDAILTDLAMKAALAIQAKNPALQEEENKNSTAMRQIQSLAYLYKNAFGKGEIDPAFASFAVKPELPKPPPPKEEDEKAAKGEGDATKPAADAAATAGDKKPADAGKKEPVPEAPKAKGKKKAKAKANGK